MKRSPMPPRVTPLESRTGLRRITEIRRVSKKREKENRLRSKVVRALFPERPRCAVPNCVRLADDVHEPLTRARGGSITDPANMIPLCRPCHDVVQLGPDWAYELGLMAHSWPDGAA